MEPQKSPMYNDPVWCKALGYKLHGNIVSLNGDRVYIRLDKSFYGLLELNYLPSEQGNSWGLL